jgi:hypothetical protein
MIRLLLYLVRLDIAIARSAPVWNIGHIEALRRREHELEMKR